MRILALTLCLALIALGSAASTCGAGRAVTIDDLRVVMKEKNADLFDEKHLKETFERYDVNADGVLCKDELENVIHNMPEQVGDDTVAPAGSCGGPDQAPCASTGGTPQEVEVEGATAKQASEAVSAPKDKDVEAKEESSSPSSSSSKPSAANVHVTNNGGFYEPAPAVGDVVDMLEVDVAVNALTTANFSDTIARTDAEQPLVVVYYASGTHLSAPSEIVGGMIPPLARKWHHRANFATVNCIEEKFIFATVQPYFGEARHGPSRNHGKYSIVLVDVYYKGKRVLRRKGSIFAVYADVEATLGLYTSPSPIRLKSENTVARFLQGKISAVVGYFHPHDTRHIASFTAFAQRRAGALPYALVVEPESPLRNFTLPSVSVVHLAASKIALQGQFSVQAMEQWLTDNASPLFSDMSIEEFDDTLSETSGDSNDDSIAFPYPRGHKMFVVPRPRAWPVLRSYDILKPYSDLALRFRGRVTFRWMDQTTYFGEALSSLMNRYSQESEARQSITNNRRASSGVLMGLHEVATRVFENVMVEPISDRYQLPNRDVDPRLLRFYHAAEFIERQLKTERSESDDDKMFLRKKLERMKPEDFVARYYPEKSVEEFHADLASLGVNKTTSAVFNAVFDARDEKQRSQQYKEFDANEAEEKVYQKERMDMTVEELEREYRVTTEDAFQEEFLTQMQNHDAACEGAKEAALTAHASHANVPWSKAVMDFVATLPNCSCSFGACTDREFLDIVEARSGKGFLTYITEYALDHFERLKTLYEKKTDESVRAAAELEHAAAALRVWRNTLKSKMEADVIADNYTNRQPKCEFPVRDANELTVEEFRRDYAIPGIPIVITGLNMTRGWTLEHIVRMCGNKRLSAGTLKRKDLGLRRWGKLANANTHTITLAEFVEGVYDEYKGWYLHDWSLPNYCPEIFGDVRGINFTMPKFFSKDYFQLIEGYAGYTQSWPSLFIGAKDTTTALHTDSGHTQFWMWMLSGKKLWRVFKRDQDFLLYRDVEHSDYKLDVFADEIDFKQFPLYARAQVCDTVLEAGQLVFIPGGVPHAVYNIEDIHSIAHNYADYNSLHLQLLDHMVWESSETRRSLIERNEIPDPLRSYIRSYELDSSSEWDGTRDMHFGDFKAQLRLMREMMPDSFDDTL